MIGSKVADEQFHVLPLYRLDPSNDDGSLLGMGEKLKEKIESGAVEVKN